ncbi:MAG TPA: rhodanese-like domain-containing protein [Rhodocyclaceae bacterium]|jgi:rhodanese-related sulfurtransferase|nr:rhodanese-like domain-containing protein [Rhodocyclaceae bacterium]
MHEISASQLDDWLKDEKRSKPFLLDVRESWEFEICHISGASLMPMGSVPQRIHELDRGTETVVICHHGIRSYEVGLFLVQQGFTQVINLRGGIAAWAQQADSRMPTY